MYIKIFFSGQMIFSKLDCQPLTSQAEMIVA